MKKIEKNTLLSFWISFYLLLFLLLIRFNKIIYSVKEFGFQIKSFNDIAFVILAICQDFFFCFFIFLLINFLFTKIKSKNGTASLFISTVIICNLILIYNVADLIYFKTSGVSISWGAILHADHIMSLLDSALLYLNFYLMFLILTGIFCISYGSILSTKFCSFSKAFSESSKSFSEK